MIIFLEYDAVFFRVLDPFFDDHPLAGRAIDARCQDDRMAQVNCLINVIDGAQLSPGFLTEDVKLKVQADGA